MRQFLLKLVSDLAIGSAATAWAAKTLGDTGHLNGWDVIKDGKTVCSEL